jgi:predicted RNA-binding protein YlxR (DUF448 family)
MPNTDTRIQDNPPRPERRAVRTCVGCRAEAERDELVRLIEGPDGAIAVDPRGSGGGRGAWVHPARACIESAAKRHGAERTLKVTVRPVDAAALIAQAREAFARRAFGLLSTARRTRAVALGADAVDACVEQGRAALLLVALDAGGVTRERAEKLASRGVLLRAFGARAALGEVFGRGEIAIAAVSEPRVAVELVTTIDRFAGLES